MVFRSFIDVNDAYDFAFLLAYSQPKNVYKL